jgi:titin
MKSHRLQLAVLLAAVASLLVFGALPAYASVPDAPTGVIASASNASAMVGWVIPANNGGSAILNYTVTPSPACGLCTGVTVTGATTSSTTVLGLTNGTPYTFTVHATNGTGNSVESGASAAITPTATSNNCSFNSFPAIPSSSSELSVSCTLTTAVGAGGNNYRIEDFPQASWNEGAGRPITTTAATAAASSTITSAAAHFTAQDVNDTIGGVGIPSNAFIKSVTSASVAVLNKAVGGVGVPNGAKLVVNNSDGRTFTDAIYPATTVATASNGVDVTTFTGATNLAVASNAHFPTTGGTINIATSDPAGAVLTYTGISGTTFLTHLNHVSGIGTLATGGKLSDPTALSSATAHFCKTALAGCNTGALLKNDVGRTISGTQIQHGTTITAVNSASSITISLPTIACPLTNPTNCNQIGLSSVPTLTATRQILDATFPTTLHVCSLTAGFGQSDVNLPITSVVQAPGPPALAQKFPAGDYITAVNSVGCPSGATGVNIHAAATTAVNANVAIGSRSSSAPINGDAVMSLSSELSVHPSEAAGEPACSFNSAVGSNLVGKWLNPGGFDIKSLGGALPLSASITGPMLGQLDVTTGAGNPAFSGYVVQSKASTAGDSDTAAHVDIVFPSLLTGIAVCPEPNDVGVATSFRFFGETLSQSAAGSGNVRSFKDLPAASPPVVGTSYEHVIKNPSSTLLTAQGNCTDQYPTVTAGFSCGGN